MTAMNDDPAALIGELESAGNEWIALRNERAADLCYRAAVALAEQSQLRETAEASRDEYARYLSDSEAMIIRLRKRAQAAEQNADQGWGEAVVSSRRARAAEAALATAREDVLEETVQIAETEALTTPPGQAVREVTMPEGVSVLYSWMCSTCHELEHGYTTPSLAAQELFEHEGERHD